MAQVKEAHKLHKSRIDLTESARGKVCELLNDSLAMNFDLYSQIKQAHWNVRSKDFYQLHNLFDEIAAEYYEYIDMIAERVTALGGYARGTVRMAAGKSHLPEYPENALHGHEHLSALAERLALFGKHVRTAIDLCGEYGDADSADLYTEISRNTDKRLWFIEAHLVD